MNFNLYKKFSFHNLLLIWILSLLVLLLTLRPYNLNHDTKVYYGILQDLLKGVNYFKRYLGYMEPSFFFIFLLSKFLFPWNPIRGVFFIYAILSVCLFYKIISRSHYKFLTLLFFLPFFFSNAFTCMRDFLASAIVLLALEDASKSKKSKFVYKIFLATFFHYSKITFLPAYYFIKKDLKQHKLLFILLPALGLGGSFFFKYLLLVIINIPFFQQELLSGFIYRIREYIAISATLRQLIVTKLPVLIIYYSLITLSYQDEKIQMYTKFLGYGLFLFYFTSFSRFISGRLYNNSLLILMLLLPHLVKLFKEKEVLIILNLLALFVLCCLTFLYLEDGPGYWHWKLYFEALL